MKTKSVPEVTGYKMDWSNERIILKGETDAGQLLGVFHSRPESEGIIVLVPFGGAGKL